MTTTLIMLFLMHVGYLAHVLSELLKVRERKPECNVNLRWMIMNRSYRLTLAYLGSIAGFAILYHIGDLSPLTAIGVGYLSSDVFTEAGRATAKRLGK